MEGPSAQWVVAIAIFVFALGEREHARHVRVFCGRARGRQKTLQLSVKKARFAGESILSITCVRMLVSGMGEWFCVMAI
jgi:hypothetical protein